MQTIILMWVTFRTDWNKEVKRQVCNNFISMIMITLQEMGESSLSLCLIKKYVFFVGERSSQEVEQMGGKEKGAPSKLKIWITYFV